jgi:hypothetical protein
VAVAVVAAEACTAPPSTAPAEPALTMASPANTAAVVARTKAVRRELNMMISPRKGPVIFRAHLKVMGDDRLSRYPNRQCLQDRYGTTRTVTKLGGRGGKMPAQTG